MEEIQLSSEKSFQIELSSDKNNSYSIEFYLNDSIEITANQINDIIHNSFSSKYSFEELREYNYFQRYDSLFEIFDEIKERIYNNKITIKENEKNLRIIIPLHSPINKEIILELKPISKSNNERINELKYLIMKLNKEINFIRNEEISDLKNEIKHLKDENSQLKNDNNNMKDKDDQLINNKIINEINLLKNDNTFLKTEVNQLKNENVKLKKEITELKEKINIVKNLSNIDSKIKKGNDNYIKSLKNWINPFKEIKTELLYRLSENGDKYSTFHELCDNKGQTLTIFHVDDGNIVGIYTPLSWDSYSKWKNDLDTFIFNLNKNQKYKKLRVESSICCDSSIGVYTSSFGCSRNKSMKSIMHFSKLIKYTYDKGSDILPSNNQDKVYNLIETEVFKILIE